MPQDSTGTGLLFIAFAIAMFALARIFHVLDRHREPRAMVPLRGAGLIFQCPVCRLTVAERHEDPATFVDALMNPSHACTRCTNALAELDRELAEDGATS